MANVSAYFIPKFCSKTTPPQTLTMNNVSFSASHGQTNGATYHHHYESTASVMPYFDFDPNRKIKLIVDGSTKTGLSSILTQLYPETQQHQFVTYDSRSTTHQAQRYFKIEIESAAIEFGVANNHIYLYGLPNSLSSTMANPFEESCHQESWNTSSESRAATTPFITKQEVQQIWQITTPDSPTTCKRDKHLGTEDKKLHWRHCGDLPAYHPYHLINSAGDAMTHRCRYCHNSLWKYTSPIKTNNPWHNASTPSNNSPNQMTSYEKGTPFWYLHCSCQRQSE